MYEFKHIANFCMFEFIFNFVCKLPQILDLKVRFKPGIKQFFKFSSNLVKIWLKFSVRLLDNKLQIQANFNNINVENT